MNALLPFPVSEPLSPSLHRRCTTGALLTLLTCPATCSTQAGVRRLPVGRGRTALCENPRQASVPGYHTHVPRRPASQGAWPPISTPYFRRRNPPLICLFSKAQGCSTLVSTVAESPELAAVDSSEQAAHLRPLILPQPRCPLGGPGPHLDREWLLSCCMCGLYWARIVMVSHCCPMMSRACCSVALRRLMPLN